MAHREEVCHDGLQAAGAVQSSLWSVCNPGVYSPGTFFALFLSNGRPGGANLPAPASVLKERE
jgi:hypothetical protein